MTILSVIIPVYNCQLFIRKCLDSVLSQKIDLEVICVDDGSTDNSKSIIESYMEQYQNIILIEQSNKGAGIARNVGTRIARGKYVHYLDSDDWVKTNLYETIIAEMETDNLDVCMFAYYRYDSKTDSVIIKRIPIQEEKSKIVSINDYSYKLINNGLVMPWNKIIKRNVIIDNSIVFDDTKCANDRTFYFALITRAHRVKLVNTPLMYYRVNLDHSLTSNTRLINFSDHFTVYHSTMNVISDQKDYIKKQIINREIEDMLGWYWHGSIEYTPRIHQQLSDFFNEISNSKLIDSNYTWYPHFNYIKNHRNCFWPYHTYIIMDNKARVICHKIHNNIDVHHHNKTLNHLSSLIKRVCYLIWQNGSYETLCYVFSKKIKTHQNK